MKIYFSLLLFVFAAGCEVKPMTSRDLFGSGETKPTFEYKRTPKDGVNLTIGTQATGVVEARYSETTGMPIYIKADVSSDPTSVLTADGQRISAMESQRIADENRAIRQEEIRSAERKEIAKNAVDTLKFGMSMIQPAVKENSTTPSANPAADQLRQQIRDLVREALQELKNPGPAPVGGTGPAKPVN